MTIQPAALLLWRARAAGRARNWPAAAAAYGALLRKRPLDSGAWVQLGHALKEQGDGAGARGAYERALALAPGLLGTWIQLGHLLKDHADPAGAVEAFARAAALAPGLAEPAEELVALGARDRLPEGSLTFEQALPRGLPPSPDMENALGEEALGRPGVYPPSRYGAWRRSLAILAPPRLTWTGAPLMVIIEAREALEAEARATLSSLLDQVFETWRAVVLAPPPLREHSVASLQALDGRVKFVDPDAGAASWPEGGYRLLVPAGVVLDRQALAWFAFAARRTGCVAAYGDHDHCVEVWRQGRRHEGPVFQPMFDPDAFADPAVTPAALLIDAARLPGWEDETGADGRRRLLLAAGRSGGVAHIPMLLASVKGLPREAEAAPVDGGDSGSHRRSAGLGGDTRSIRRSAGFQPALLKLPAGSRRSGGELGGSGGEVAAGRIQVVIQTRDAAAMLRACVESLRATAEAPGRLDITIVDNRSAAPETGRLLDRFRSEGVEILALDEPFNWSRANNLAVARGAAPLLLFLNNDTEMLSPGWDGALRRALADPDVGIVGALLLYPDRTIQHAGMVFGMGTGGPTHEGVGQGEDDPGPGGRWARARAAAGVTGACMALRRGVFEAAGGFDAAAFAIAFNDVDLCLRVRAAGLRVVMRPEIRLIHHESKTRGLNITRSRVAWDLEEFSLLWRRWGHALFEDPGYNPHWSREGRPFDGLRFPGLREIVRHIDRSATEAPWAVTEGGEEPAWW